MARFNAQDAVIVTFKTANIDNQPYQNVQSAKVISHHCAGWILLKFKTGSEYQFRVHYVKDGTDSFENYKNEKVHVNIKKQSK
jgi:hypothetical protein